MDHLDDSDRPGAHMLTARRTAAVASLAMLALGAPTQFAAADGPGGGVVCPPDKLDCDITAESPGKPADSEQGRPSSGAGGSGKPTCAIDSQEVPCTRDDFGVFNSADACYWQVLQPQPGPQDPVWGYATGVPEDWKPGDPGKLYNVICPGAGRELMGGTTFSATDPAAAPAVDPAQLAQEAVEKMTLLGPQIGITPKPGGKGVIGMPVYMWTEKGPETYGPNVASASAGGVTVTATAKVRKIVWTMGDGKTITCTTPGTPYKAEYGKKPSPDCGHRYSVPSSTTSSGTFHVTATSTWAIGWEATSGPTGQLTEVRDSAVDITVAEVQVLN
nr:ATP/GTP-binding protein [Streptomyces halstedii]